MIKKTVCLFVFQAALALAAEQPNIILILADDMGYGDCGAFNPDAKIKTPHIDQLAREGLRFTDAHAAASTCTPSRYGLLTGINPVRTGVLNTLLSKGDPIISEDEKTLAHLLKDQGYQTHMVGKWHLGFELGKKNKKTYDFSKNIKGGPVDRGFDSFLGVLSSVGSSPASYVIDRSMPSLPTEKGHWIKYSGAGKESNSKVEVSPNWTFEDVSPRLCEEVKKVIRKHASADQKEPFFLYYAMTGPHQPWVPTKDFKGKSGLGNYADFMMQLDDEVGQINALLKETGLDENTLLIFTSDNGPGPGAVFQMNEHNHTAAGGLRGSKADVWEGGHRIPFIAKWPGKVGAGASAEANINFTDLFATFAEMLSVDFISDYPSVKDSESFYIQLFEPEKESTRGPMINGSYSIREGPWKLTAKKRMKNATASALVSPLFSLNNLHTDLAEENDLSDQEPEKKKDLLGKLKAFVDEQKFK